MKLKRIVFILVIGLAVINCSKHSLPPTPFLLLLQEDARTQYVSYVTNEKKELLHAMDYIDRNYVRSDTIADKIVHYFLEKGQIYGFYIDKEGSLWQEVKIDLAVYALNAGFTYREPIAFSYWKPLIKRNKGIGTSWSTAAQQTFVVYDSLNRPHTLKYSFEGQATLVGWAEVIVPANRNNLMKTIHVRWNHFSNTLFDLTDDCLVWQQKGEAGDYFDPEIGLIRSIADYTITKRDGKGISRKSTFELYLLIAGAASKEKSKGKK